MDAIFRHNVEDRKPQVSYNISGEHGELVVEYPEIGGSIPADPAVVMEWNLLFSNTVPIDLEIQTSAGNSELNLKTLNLTGLHIDVSAGTTVVDLTNALDHDLRATITGGFADITVNLPKEMGVQVSGDTDLGELTDAGLRKDGNVYVNEFYGNSPPTLFLDIDAGVGDIHLLTP